MPEHELIGDRLERAIEARTDVEAELERGQAGAPQRASLRRSLIWLTITGVSLYLVAPSLMQVFSSADDLAQIDPLWLPAMAGLEAAALASLWALQRTALHTRRWRPVIASQLAGGALAKVAPAGGAVGAALQYRMLVEAGFERGRSAAALTAVNLLIFAVVLMLPVLALPAIVRGGVSTDLVDATLVGLAVFAVLLVLGVLALALDGPLLYAGHALQRLRNRLRRRSPPLRGLPDRLLRERDRILATSARAGSVRWRPPSPAGRSTTGSSWRRWRRWDRPLAPPWCCWRSAPRSCSPRSRPPRAAWGSWRRA